MIDNDTPDEQTISISTSAIWALERLTEIRYGRDAPALGWSVTRELISAGYVDYPSGTRSGITVTAAGRAFLKGRK
ncbi:hypothetical protein [Paraburkholderia sp. J11-2]|uniref:hypothetical protein n=1 Tax=Paraburkholderia sp. J11-2 TaxID=2805431 RepID=UPI002AB6DC49|nr:hypothetical protein [Paraburkholderia sp. J11-2]